MQDITLYIKCQKYKAELNRQFPFGNCQNKIQADFKIHETRKAWNTMFTTK